MDVAALGPRQPSNQASNQLTELNVAHRGTGGRIRVGVLIREGNIVDTVSEGGRGCIQNSTACPCIHAFHNKNRLSTKQTKEKQQTNKQTRKRKKAGWCSAYED
jgi:hypothetical protein